jgi:hypothetical protein
VAGSKSAIVTLTGRMPGVASAMMSSPWQQGATLHTDGSQAVGLPGA